jgi:KaiC/GvpD/RAD55 family RecA-like ATPase
MSHSLNEIFPAGTEWAEQEAAKVLAACGKNLPASFSLKKLPIALPVIDPREWQGKSVPERQWFVEGWIPDRTVTNLSGDGGSGKTLIVMQLIAASSLRTQWFGHDVSPGPCLYYGAEDEPAELHRRLETIVRNSDRQLSDLEGIRLIPMAGSDAVLAEPDRNGHLTATALFQKLESETKALRPKLIVIDPSADVFGGDEINRSQVRKFVSMLRGLAIDYDCAVLLLSHPSLAGLPWLNRSHRCIVGIASIARADHEAGCADIKMLNLLRQCLGQLGASPADASKITMPDDDETPDDPAAKYFA